MRTLLALRFAVPFGVLVLSTLPIAAVQAQELSREAETLILQEVIDATMSETELSPEDALDDIRSGLLLGLEDGERDLLNGFSLSDQGNLALVRQEGARNEALIGQHGTGNAAILLQLGQDNLTSLRQDGNGNVFGVRIDGSGNTLVGTAGGPGVLQTGNDNVYLLEHAGNDTIIPPTVQDGDGNQAVQVGEIALPFGVEQHGNDMRMIIRHNGAE